jgi:HlyD family secretion protein
VLIRDSLRPAALILAGLLFASLTTSADDLPKDKKGDKKKEEMPKAKKDEVPKEKIDGPKWATVKVERGPLTASTTIRGIVEGSKSTEVSVRPKTWSGQLIVETAVEYGAPVKLGEPLVAFETEKLLTALRDAKEERELALLSIKQAELEVPLLRKQLPLDQELAEREFKQQTEDLKRFLEVEKPMSVESAEQSLKSSKFYLDSSKEELKQLQKMYRDKDLTEETEQMILKRYQHGVEQSEFFYRQAKLQTERTLNIEIPRRELSAKTSFAKAELGLSRARELFPLQMKQKELALEKLRYDEARAKEKLADLEKDLALMTVKSPADGLAYHGRYIRGQWVTPSSPNGPALMRGNAVNPGEVIFTVISKGRLVLRGEIDEKEFASLKVGQVARIAAVASPDKKQPGRVQRIAAVPQGGRFEVRIEFDDEAPAGLVPGMSGTARVITAKKEATLFVPNSAVFEDAETETSYVWVPVKADKAAKPVKKTVTTGIVVGEKTEILTGLVEGDEILPNKP